MACTWLTLLQTFLEYFFLNVFRTLRNGTQCVCIVISDSEKHCRVGARERFGLIQSRFVLAKVFPEYLIRNESGMILKDMFLGCIRVFGSNAFPFAVFPKHFQVNVYKTSYHHALHNCFTLFRSVAVDVDVIFERNQMACSWLVLVLGFLEYFFLNGFETLRNSTQYVCIVISDSEKHCLGPFWGNTIPTRPREWLIRNKSGMMFKNMFLECIHVLSLNAW